MTEWRWLGRIVGGLLRHTPGEGGGGGGTGDGAAVTPPATPATPAAGGDSLAAAAAQTPATPATGATPAAGAAAGTETGKTPAPGSAKPGEGAGVKPTEPPKPPEKYALSVPEAGRAHVEATDLQYLETVARKAGWTNEEAQAALDEHVATLQAASQRFLEQTTADPEIGGAHLAESQRLARAVINRVRPEGHPRRASFLQFLNRGGAGNHLEVVAFLRDLGTLMAEPGPVGGTGGVERKPTADVLYDRTAPAR